MGIKTLNTVGGISVGYQSSNVILSNADVISNNLTVGKTANLGDISNVRILGGSLNYFLKTDGQGNLSWAPGGSGAPGGSNTQIQFNDDGSFNGVSNFTYNKNTNLLNVDGNVTVGDNTNNVRLFSSGAISSTGNLSAANINTGGVLSVTGNANVGNIGATNGVFTNISGTLTTASQPNITAVGTLTSLSVSGNANVGNLGATNGIFTNISGNGAGITDVAAITAQTVTNAAQPNITSVGTLSSLNIDGNLVVGNNLTVNGNLTYLNVETVAVEDPIIELQTGANGAPLNSNTGKDVGTALNYYNTAAQVAFMGWDTSNAEIAFGSNVSIANEVVTFNQLANTRSGNTLTTGLFATTLSATGNANVGNIGATNGVFTSVSGNGAALTSINGSNITGQVANALVAGTVYTNAQPNITSTGTLTSLSVSGNANIGNIGTAGLITATGNIQGGNLITTGILSVGGNANVGNLGVTGVFATTLSATGNANVGNIGATNGVFTNVSGNGALLTNITGANVTGTVANATFATTAGSATTAGTVTTNAQPNITSLGTLTSLSVSGNANIGNIGVTGVFATTLSATGNANVGNLGATNGVFTNVSGNGALLTNLPAGNISGQVANALVAGTVYTNAQPNITSTGTLTSLSVSGNANIGNIGTAGLITATGNITGGNVIATLHVGNLSGTGNSNVGNLGVTGVFATTLSATGNANVGNIGATNGVFTNVSGNGALLTNLNASNITGQVANALVAGTVYTNAQPNITSLGTLSSLNIDGNLVVGNNLFVNGNLTYFNVETVAVEDPIIQLQTGANGAAPSSNTGKDVGTALNYYDTAAKIAFMGWDTSNAEIAFGSNVSIANEVVTFNQLANTRSGNTLTTGVFATTLSATGNANVGNIGATNGVFTNVSGNGSGLTSLPGSNVTGQVANALVAGTVYTNAQPNITSVGTLSSLSVSGNANVGNLGTAGLITATGNIQGGNLLTNGSLLVGATAPTANVHVQGTANGAIRLRVENLSNGTGAFSQYTVTAPESALNGYAFANGYTTSGRFVQTSGLIDATGLGGLGLAASGALANMRFYVNTNNLRMIIDNSGNVGIGNSAPTHTLSVTGTFNLSGNANVGNIGATNGVFTNISGTLTTAGQTNITAVGTLTTLSVSGNANVGNLGTAGLITATGAIQTSSTLSAVGNANVGNLGTAGLITATGNIQGGNLRTTGILSVGGNANVGNLGVTGVFATTLSATGNANVGNLGVTGVFATTLSATGNANVGNIGATNGVFTNVSGNGAALTNLSAASITGQVANALVAGTVYTNAQPNITSVGTLTSLTTSGQIIANGATGRVITGLDSGGSLSMGLVSGTATFPYIDFNTSANAVDYDVRVQASGNAGTVGSGQLTITAATLSATGNANIGGNIQAAGFISAAGNVTGNFFIGNGSQLTGIVASSTTLLANGTSNVAIPTASGNINFTIGGAANEVVFTSTGANVNGYLSVSGNANIANIGTAGLITATGAIQTSSTLSATGNANVGNIGATNGVFTNISGTLTTAGQTNITAVGTLTTLSVSGNANVGNLGTAGLITATGAITGGSFSTSGNSSANRFLAGNGTAALPSFSFTSDPDTGMFSNAANVIGFSTAGTQRVSISTTDIITTVPIDAANGTAAAPAYGFSSDTNTGIYATGTADQLAISTGGSERLLVSNSGATITGALSATGNANVGNIGATNGVFTNISGTLTTAGQTNITAVGTLTTLSVSGNANVGNLGTAGLITATGNIGGGNLNTTGVVSASRLISTVATGTAPFTVTSTTQVANLNAATAGSATTAGTVTTAAQGNITSVGILTSLSVSGNANANVFYAGNGTAALPSYSFSADTNTGIYSPGADQVGISTGGTLRLTVTTAQFTGTLPWRGQAGNATAPAVSFSADTNTGIWSSGADTLNFGTNGSEGMRINSSGNVGIGETNPNFKLTILGPSTGAGSGQFRITPPGTAQGQRSAATFYSTFEGTGDNGPRRSADIIAGFNGGAWGTEFLTFNVGEGGAANDTANVTTERMRINGSGNVGIGTAAPAHKLEVVGGTFLNGSLGIGTAPSGTTGEIRATNEITAYYSDRRLKENVKLIDNAVEKVSSLNGITYTPNDLARSFGYTSDKTIVGLFADEVDAVLPEAVRLAPFDQDEDGKSKSGENYQTIQYEKIVPLLVEAIKELNTKVKDLMAEVETLRAKG